uniref:Protein kinase domain-containing protein n=1 Tax=Mesocestoides corti TaxID=53468 RepID=A0A5K3FET7_MESCO
SEGIGEQELRVVPARKTLEDQSNATGLLTANITRNVSSEMPIHVSALSSREINIPLILALTCLLVVIIGGGFTAFTYCLRRTCSVELGTPANVLNHLDCPPCFQRRGDDISETRSPQIPMVVIHEHGSHSTTV